MEMGHMTFKRVLALLMAAFVAPCLFSCAIIAQAPKTEPTLAPEPEESISFRITWKDYSGRGQAITKIVEGYNALSADDTIVKVISGDEDLAAIQALLETPQETVFVLPYRYVQYFGDQGLLYDLTEQFTEEEGAFYPEVWNLGKANGITYGIPWLGHARCLLDN
jgi:multiple sugar transport system substrate-binding protein